MPPRTAPLRARTPLESTPGLSRSQGPERRVPLRQVSPGRARENRQRRAPRDTGPSAAVRGIVWNRDYGWCARCGLAFAEKLGGYSIHHRVLRSQGTDNAPPNLLLLCGSGTTGCHGWAHANITAAREMGWLLLESQDPAAEPVMVAVPGGWRKYWLLPDGGRTTDAPEEAAA